MKENMTAGKNTWDSQPRINTNVEKVLQVERKSKSACVCWEWDGYMHTALEKT